MAYANNNNGCDSVPQENEPQLRDKLQCVLKQVLNLEECLNEVVNRLDGPTIGTKEDKRECSLEGIHPLTNEIHNELNNVSSLLDYVLRIL